MRLPCGEDGVVAVGSRLELISGISVLGAISVIGILRQLTVLPCAVALAITAHQDVTFLTDRTRFICVYISAFAFYYPLLAGL